MIRKTTALLGAGVLAAGLAGPLNASAHADDNALAFVLGAAVGQAIDNDSHRERHARYERQRHRAFVTPVHHGYAPKHYRYAHPHAWRKYQRAKWRHDYRRFQRHLHRHDRRFDRRWDKHHRRWDKHHGRFDEHHRRWDKPHRRGDGRGRH